jgi:GNAT superfamily N-acetyltransferase
VRDDSAVTIDFRTVDAAAAPATELVEAMWAEVVHMYPAIGDETGPSATAADFSPPGGTFVAGFEGDAAITGGGIKRLDERTCEFKRMFVVREARGRGVARALLAAMEDAARELGYGVVRLDTGRFQNSARRMYVASGYRTIADYNDNPYASFWGEKAL